MIGVCPGKNVSQFRRELSQDLDLLIHRMHKGIPVIAIESILSKYS
jgi:hypothetical protein